ncbi:MAG: murein hydrolase activator EnvC family protein [Dermatophilaceae bacterium]
MTRPPGGPNRTVDDVPSSAAFAAVVAGITVAAATLAGGPGAGTATGDGWQGAGDPNGLPAIHRSGPVWAWPLSPRPQVLREFIAPRSEYGPGHRGIDLSGSAGTAVRAVDDGVVLHAGPVAGRGTVTVRHRSGLESTYEPLDARVTRGDRVSAGGLVGVLSGPARGAVHCGATVCLHLGARRGDGYLDPLPLLIGGRVVLLPLTGTAGPTSAERGRGRYGGEPLEASRSPGRHRVSAALSTGAGSAAS